MVWFDCFVWLSQPLLMQPAPPIVVDRQARDRDRTATMTR